MRATGETVEIAGGDAHKIVHVLRLKPGDAVELVDSAGRTFAATLIAVDRTVRATLGEPIVSAGAERFTVDLAQGVPKGQKMDFIVEKATELGVGRILPFYSERTVVHDLGESKLERWRRLAKSAAQQCGRERVPEIDGPSSFDSLIERFKDYDAVLLPWELAPQRPLPGALGGTLDAARRILVAIGPEGGFSHAESNAAQEAGALLVSLGRRILRTETAGLALLSYLSLID